MLFSILMALFIISKHEKSGFKIIWILLIMIFPLFGGYTYIIFNEQVATRKFRKGLTDLENETRKHFLLPSSSGFSQTDLSSSSVEGITDFSEYQNNIRYLENFAGFPIYTNSIAEYLSPGEKFFPVLLEELKRVVEKQ